MAVAGWPEARGLLHFKNPLAAEKDGGEPALTNLSSQCAGGGFQRRDMGGHARRRALVFCRWQVADTDQLPARPRDYGNCT